MRPLTPDYPLETLTTLNMQEMLRAFKLESQRGVRWLAQRGLYALVQQLSSLVLPTQLQNAAMFVFFLLIVILRPQGLFGRVAERT